jgi:predicted ABC-type ATPase
MPKAIIIAGPNGAGKTRFARQFLANEAATVQIVSADLIAAGLLERLYMELVDDWVVRDNQGGQPIKVKKSG